MSAPSRKLFDPIRMSDYADRLAAWAEGKQRDEPDPRPARPTDPLEDWFATQSGHEDKGLSAAPPAPEDAHERAADELRWGDDEGILHRSEASGTSSDEEGARDNAYSHEECAYGDPSPQRAFKAGVAAYEVDLQRLEAALLAARQGEADESVSRLPPASGLPPPPMRERTNHWGAVLRVLGACAVAAPIAYSVLNYFGAGNELLMTIRAPKLSMVETQTAALPPMPATQPAAASSSAPSLIPSPPAAPTAHRRAPTIDREDIAMLLKQGDQLISAGDVATARVLFERAAQAGDGKGALALGATYDPVVLTKLGVRGIAPDVEKAHHWYQEAREFGLPEIPTWLAELADR